MPGFGRLEHWETRNAKAAYPMHLVLAEAPPALPLSKVWLPGPVLDQGDQPMCVGYSTKDNLNCEPEPALDPTPGQDPSPEQIYAAAQAVDGIPLPHDGTTVRAAMEAIRAEGRISAYLWATAWADFASWLSTRGPIVVGTNWYAGMMHPDANGFVPLSGKVVGGHAYLVHGIHNDARYVVCQNSWGTGWGQGGFFNVRFADMARLLFLENGEAAGFLEPGAPPPAPVPPPPAVDPRLVQAEALLAQGQMLLRQVIGG